jgi:dimethylamine monooxygenase subunit C
MSENITLVPEKRYYLFCADEEGIKLLQPLIDVVKDRNISYEIQIVKDNWSNTLFSEWLSMQKMGSFLYVSAEWNTLKKLKQLAEDAGFSEEEAKYIGYGKEQIKVFCCRCHGISVLEKGKPERNCDHCGLLLEVSDHYSKLRDAFLGYVAKL